MVDQLVDPSGLEAGWKVDVRVRGYNGAFGALVIEAAASFDASKMPGTGRHYFSGIAGVAPPRQTGLRGVQGCCRMAPGRCAPTEREDGDAGLIGNELDADRTCYGAPIVG